MALTWYSRDHGVVKWGQFGENGIDVVVAMHDITKRWEFGKSDKYVAIT